MVAGPWIPASVADTVTIVALEETNSRAVGDDKSSDNGDYLLVPNRLATINRLHAFPCLLIVVDA